VANITPNTFDKEASVLREVYVQFGANDPSELQTVYMDADQVLMNEVRWDYDNPELLPNKIRMAIEAVGISAISGEKERKWIGQILWMWYHHAISCALWRYGDKKAAQEYSARALELQPVGHPNSITRLLYLLIRDDLDGAEQWAETITTEPEKTTATYFVDLYKQGDFFEVQHGNDGNIDTK